MNNNQEFNEFFNSIKSERDPLFEEAGRFCIQESVGSVSSIQRKFKIDSMRASSIMQQLYDIGLVGDEDKYRKRKIYMSIEEFVEAIKKEE